MFDHSKPQHRIQEVVEIETIVVPEIKGDEDLITSKNMLCS